MSHWHEIYGKDIFCTADSLIKFFITLKKPLCLPNLLFYGPPGCGKTSMINFFRNFFHKHGYGEYVKNASLDRRIETIRSLETDFLQLNPLISKVVFFDEADQLTEEAQAALKALVEKNIQFYTSLHVNIELKVIFNNSPTRAEIMEIAQPILSHVKKFRIHSDAARDSSIVLRFPTRYYKEFIEDNRNIIVTPYKE
jgi:DNA polymerase III delta prime subunit